MKKYEMLQNDTKKLPDGKILYRIRALRDVCNDITKGTIGCYIEKEENLSHEGFCWVYGNAQVYDNASVRNYASVSDNATVNCNAIIKDEAMISDSAFVTGNAVVDRNAFVGGWGCVYDDTKITDHAIVCDYAKISGDAILRFYAVISGRARIDLNAIISDETDYFTVGPIGSRYDFTTFYMSKYGNIEVCCGCCNVSIDEFVKRVKEVYGEDTKYGQTYMMAADLARKQILSK